MYNNIMIKFNKAKEIIIVFLLTLWITIPVFKEIRSTSRLIAKYNLEYIFLILIGFLGVVFLIFNIYTNLRKVENRKEYFKQQLPIIILFIYMIWTLVSTLSSNNVQNAMFGTEYRKDGYITYIAYAGFFSLAFNINSKENRNFIVNMLIAMAILNIILVELYNLGLFRTVLVPRSRKLTCFYNRNHYGYYLLLAIASSIFSFITQKNKVSKVLYFISSIFLLYFFILNDTFGCFLALIITLIFFMIYCIWKKRLKVNPYLTLFAIILITLSFTNTQISSIVKKNIETFYKDIHNIILAIQSLDEENNQKTLQLAEKAGSTRIKLWINGINFFIDNPILGYGPDSLKTKYLEVGINKDRPHNLLIQLATTSGIIGLLTYTIAIGIILIRGVKKIKFDNPLHLTVLFVVISYLISAMFGNSMYYTSPYFFIFLGLLMNENINSNDT